MKEINMKKKIFLGVFALLLVLQTQTVFAQREFFEMFAANDIDGIEKLLKEHGNQMNKVGQLEICLNTVNYSLAMLFDISPIEGGYPLNSNRNNIFKCIQLLVNAGVDLNKYVQGCYVKNENGNIVYSGAVRFSNTLSIAASGKNQFAVSIVKYLLESGADMYPDLFTTSDDYLAINRVLIENGYNVNCFGGFGYGDRNVSPLYAAAGKGSIATVKLLVESGAMVNQQLKNYVEDGKKHGVERPLTAAEVAYKYGHIDIYNYLKQNGATWSPPSQVASTPPSSQSRQTYDSYDYSPPPSSSKSSSSSSSSGSSWADVGKAIADAFVPPLDSGTYGLSGTQAKISIVGIAKSGMLFFTNRQGKQVRGTYNIDGNTMTIQADGYTYVYTITSKTSFSGHGETWVRTGY
jgi:hypothetical protein